MNNGILKYNLIFRTVVGMVLVLLILISTMPAFFSYALSASAETSTVVEFDSTDIYDDLADEDISRYTASADKSYKMIKFVEYCYSNENDLLDYYNLYFYVYSPKKENVTSMWLSMAMEYNSVGDPVEYNMVSLTLCSVTDDNLIYKYKLTTPMAVYNLEKPLAESFHYRRYDINELSVYSPTRTDYSVGGTWKFSGYAAGCENNNSISTLTAQYAPLEQVDFTVYSTSYRSGAIDKTADFTTELHSVYFSIPQKFFNNYGELQKVKARWFENQTTPIYVTSDYAAYCEMKDYICQSTPSYGRYPYFANLDYGVLAGTSMTNPDGDGYSYSPYLIFNNRIYTLGYTTNYYLPYNDYNFEKLYTDTPMYGACASQATALGWLFYRNNLDDGVTADELKKYETEYNTDYNTNQYFYSNSVELDRVQYLDESEKGYGWVTREFDAGDDGIILTYDDTHSGWDKFCDFFWHWGTNTGGGGMYNVIQPITKDDLTKSASDLFIGEDDLVSFRTFCISALSKGERPFLLRFAETDYFSTTSRFVYYKCEINGTNVTYSVPDLLTDDGYVAVRTIFKEFDILSLTFKGETGNYTVLPVNAQPIDIYVGAGAPLETPILSDWLTDKLKLVLIVVAIIIFCIIFAPLLPYVIKFIVWLITLPFKGISALIKAIKKKE